MIKDFSRCLHGRASSTPFPGQLRRYAGTAGESNGHCRMKISESLCHTVRFHIVNCPVVPCTSSRRRGNEVGDILSTYWQRMRPCSSQSNSRRAGGGGQAAMCGTGRSEGYGLAVVRQNGLSRYPFSALPSPGNSTNLAVTTIPRLLLLQAPLYNRYLFFLEEADCNPFTCSS